MTPSALRLEAALWLALAVFVIISRVLAAPEILAEWDSANYALGIRGFDVYEHRPHSPGYPLFVLALWCASAVPGPETLPFLFVNGLLSLAVLGLLGLVVRAEVGRAVAFAVAVGFAVCPVFWYHGAMATAYVAECFASVLVASAAWALARRRIGVVAAAAALVVAVGLRPNSALYLAPVMALGLLWSRQSWRRWLTFAGVAAGGTLTWLVPTVALSGGWGRYWTTTRALARWQSETDSVLSGSLGLALENLGNLVLYLTDSLNLLLVLMVVCLPIALLRRRFKAFWPLFLTVWCLPPALIYTLHHLPKAGYVLTILPGLFLAAGLIYGAARHDLSRRWGWVMAALGASWTVLVVATNVAAFSLAVPERALEEQAEVVPSDAVVVVTGDYGWRGIRWRTEPQRRLRDLVDRLGGEGTVLLFLWGTHQLQRIETVYHPEQWMLASALDHGCVYSNRHPTEDYCGSFGDFQVRILSPPDGGLTNRLLTSLDRFDDRLVLSRASREVEVVLDPVPTRLLVVIPGPPCEVHIGEGLGQTAVLEVSSRFRLLVLDARDGDSARAADRGGPP